MPTIVIASPKGGAGKSSAAVLLGGDLRGMQAQGAIAAAQENAAACAQAVYGRLSGAIA